MKFDSVSYVLNYTSPFCESGFEVIKGIDIRYPPFTQSKVDTES